MIQPLLARERGMAPQAVAVSSAALSHALIAQAVSRSVDGADTLDLSRQHIGSVPDEAVQELTKVGREGRGVRRSVLHRFVGLLLPPPPCSSRPGLPLPPPFQLLARLRASLLSIYLCSG